MPPTYVALTMSGYKLLQAHLQGVAKLLASLKDQPCLDSVAGAQKQAVLQSLQGVVLTGEQAADLNKLIADGGWPGDMASSLIGEVSKRISAMPAVEAARAKLQNFEAIHGYFTMSQWHGFSDRSIAAEPKLDAILDHSVALGMRNPTESTVQLITTLWRLSVVGPEHLAMIPYGQKLEFVHFVKRAIKRKTANLAAPLHYLVVLPCASQFKVDHPEIYGATFLSGDPVVCPIPMATLKEHQSSFPMRSTKRCPMVAQQGSSTDQMLQMMHIMMQQIRGGGRDAGSSSDDVRIQMLTPRSAQALVQRAQTIEIEDRPSVEVGPSEVPKVEVGPSQVEVGPSSKSLGKQSVPSKVDVGPASKSLGKQSAQSCTKAILDAMVDRSTDQMCCQSQGES